MLIKLLLPDPTKLKFENWRCEDETLIVEVSTIESAACCPYCGTMSHRIHSYYERKPLDLPWSRFTVRLMLRVRRFYCNETSCRYQTFVERLPSIIAPYARRTSRLTEAQEDVALCLGGEVGARVLTGMRMPSSPDSVLRLIRDSAEPAGWTPKVLGVDDWAFRKGQNYGTILVDLERNRPVDLLPERSAESLAQWLLAHPGVEVISRDRGNEYIKGATLGAPDAIQVADRWHLLKNLRDTLQRLLERNRNWLRVASKVDEEAADTVETTPTSLATRPEKEREARRAIRQERFQAVNDLHRAGISKREIARRFGMSFNTVTKYIESTTCPFYPEGRRSRSLLDPYLDYLQAEWDAGRHNASQLWREIRGQGFAGSRGLVAIWAAEKRKDLANPKAKGATSDMSKTPPLPASKAVWLFLKSDEDMSADDESALKRMMDSDPQVEWVRSLTQDFVEMLKKRRTSTLSPWLKAVSKCQIRALQKFADGLRKDIDAVRAALELPWSNGQVEGQVNRLKFIKRSMYGRANFDLLRKRVLARPHLLAG